VARDLEEARRERRVRADDVRDLHQHVPTGLLELVLARVEEHVARELDHHAVVAHDDLEADRVELLEARLEVLEAGLDRGELVGALLVLLERLLEIRLRLLAGLEVEASAYFF
jgi:hypothetical protein